MAFAETLKRLTPALYRLRLFVFISAAIVVVIAVCCALTLLPTLLSLLGHRIESLAVPALLNRLPGREPSVLQSVNCVSVLPPR